MVHLLVPDAKASVNLKLPFQHRVPLCEALTEIRHQGKG
jgi:hypothetical protein